MLRKILDYTLQKNELLANFQASRLVYARRSEEEERAGLASSLILGRGWLPSSGRACTITQHVPQSSLYKAVATQKFQAIAVIPHFLFEATRSERLSNRLNVSKVVSEDLLEINYDPSDYTQLLHYITILPSI